MTINVARLPDDRRLMNGLAATLAAVFPSVYVADVPYSMNSILYATRAPTTIANLHERITAPSKTAGGVRRTC